MVSESSGMSSSMCRMELCFLESFVGVTIDRRFDDMVAACVVLALECCATVE